MPNKIGVGIIGANPDRGWAKSAHIPALSVLPQYEIRAISISRQETAIAAAKQFNVPLAFDDYRKLIAHPDVDLVTIAVKVPHHHELVTAAIEAGKHIYCEWPLGNGLAEAIELADLARRSNVRTAIGLQGRAAPAINRLRDLITQGCIGTVLSTSMVISGEYPSDVIDQANTYMLDKQNGANLLTIQTGHYADVITYVSIHLLHILNNLAIDPKVTVIRVVISGHSHKPLIEERNGVLFLNPGSAGSRRFKLPVTLAYLHLDGTAIQAEIVDLGI